MFADARKDRCKVVVRGLPPLVARGVVEETVRQLCGDGPLWFRFVQGKASAKRTMHSLAYLQLASAAAVPEFKAALQRRTFITEKGQHYRASVEYAPFQRVPPASFKRDPREGTLAADPEYQRFLDQLRSDPEALFGRRALEAREQALAGTKGGLARGAVEVDGVLTTPLVQLVLRRRLGLPDPDLPPARPREPRGGARGGRRSPASEPTAAEAKGQRGHSRRSSAPERPQPSGGSSSSSSSRVAAAAVEAAKAAASRAMSGSDRAPPGLERPPRPSSRGPRRSTGEEGPSREPAADARAGASPAVAGQQRRQRGSSSAEGAAASLKPADVSAAEPQAPVKLLSKPPRPRARESDDGALHAALALAGLSPGGGPPRPRRGGRAGAGAAAPGGSSKAGEGPATGGGGDARRAGGDGGGSGRGPKASSPGSGGAGSGQAAPPVKVLRRPPADA